MSTLVHEIGFYLYISVIVVKKMGRMKPILSGYNRARAKLVATFLGEAELSYNMRFSSTLRFYIWSQFS